MHKLIQNFVDQVKDFKENGQSFFTTSSFQSHSLVMLHILKDIDPSTPIYFINTGYHFPETIFFKNQLAEDWKLNILDIKSETPRHMQKDPYGKLLFASDPEHCCSINKTQPTEELLKKYDIWINGVRRDQSSVRKEFNEFESATFGAKRYHPMLDWTSKMIFSYRKEHNLPSHPLDEKGYLSIGCEPCTRRVDTELMEREARWYGLSKTECGLHTDLIKK